MTGFDLDPDGIPAIVKDPGDALSYGLAWYEWLRGADQYWTPQTLVKPGDTYTPPQQKLNGHRYRCTVGGRTGKSEPTWPTSGSTTVTDGNVTWARIGVEDTISAVTVTAETGLTKASEAVDAAGTVTSVDLSGGTAGRDYLVNFAITTVSGKTAQRRIRVKVRERH